MNDSVLEQIDKAAQRYVISERDKIEARDNIAPSLAEEAAIRDEFMVGLAKLWWEDVVTRVVVIHSVGDDVTMDLVGQHTPADVCSITASDEVEPCTERVSSQLNRADIVYVSEDCVASPTAIGALSLCQQGVDVRIFNPNNQEVMETV